MKATSVAVTFLENIKAGKIETAGNLGIAPLKSPLKSAVKYLLLNEALETGKIVITESSQHGSVGTLQADVAETVLVLDGDELKGAKQNRLVTTSILLEPGKGILLPVNCTEQGRWAYTSNRFSSRHHSSSRMRAENEIAVRQSLKEKRGFAGDQQRTWQNVNAMHCDMGVASPTRAAEDAYVQVEREERENIAALAAPKKSNGVIAMCGDFMCIDAFANEETIAKIWDRLIRSYAVDARRARKPKKMNAKNASGLINGVLDGNTEASEHESIGAGTDVRIVTPTSVGHALVHNDEVIHLALFEKPATDIILDDRELYDRPIRRPSARRDTDPWRDY